MTLNILPGEPNRSPACVSLVNWNAIQILCYCSGNNLVILTKGCQHLQTIYLPKNASVVDINRINGKIAVSLDDQINIYTPKISNFYNFTFSGSDDISELKIEWELETEIFNKKDTSSINCISWSDSCDSRDEEMNSNQFFGLPDEYNSEVSCELVTGSNNSLTLWRLYYKNIQGEKTIHKKQLWYKEQPNPVYMVKFSPNSTAIASIGFFDKLVKLWHRVSYGIESSDFDLTYLPHNSQVSNIRWRKPLINIKPTRTNTESQTVASSSAASISRTYNSIVDLSSISTTVAAAKEHNVLYTIASDSIMRIYSTLYNEHGFTVSLSGSLDMWEGTPVNERKGEKFCLILDNSILNYGLLKLLDTFESNPTFLTNNGSENNILSLPKDKKIATDNNNNIVLDDNPGITSSSSSVSFNIDSNSFDGIRSRSNSNVSMGLYIEEHLANLYDEKLEICLIINEKGEINMYKIKNLNVSVPSPLVFTKMNQKFNNGNNIGSKYTETSIQLGPNCLPKDCRSVFFQDFSLSVINDKNELSLIVHDLFKDSIRHIGFNFKDLLVFNNNDNDENENRSRDNGGGNFSSTSMNNTQKTLTSQNSTLLSPDFLSKELQKFKKPMVSVIGELEHKFTGHNKSIQSIVRSADGSSILSVTRFCENYLWIPLELSNNNKTLSKKAVIVTPSRIINANIWLDGKYCIVLVEGELICFDCRFESLYQGDQPKLAPICGSIKIDKPDVPICLISLPEDSEKVLHVVAIYKDRSCIAWEINLVDDGGTAEIIECPIESLPNGFTSRLPSSLNINLLNDKKQSISSAIGNNKKLSFDSSEEIYMSTAIDPMGWKVSLNATSQRDLLSTIDKNGFVRIYTCEVVRDPQNKNLLSVLSIRWKLKHSFMTGIEEARKIKASSIHKLAIVDKAGKKLHIWDYLRGTLEYEEDFSDDVDDSNKSFASRIFNSGHKLDAVINDIDWTCTVNNQSILAVGFNSHSLLYTQLRYDYTNNAPTFCPIKLVDITDQTTHKIGDSVWLADGLLVIGSGNQFYISDKSLDPNTDVVTRHAIGAQEILANDIFHLCSALNGPLPLYHPQFLIQSLFYGKFSMVEKILYVLCKKLRKLDLNGGDIHSFLDPVLGLILWDVLKSENNKSKLNTNNSNNTINNKSNSVMNRYKDLFHNNSSNDDKEKFTTEIAKILSEKLQKHKLPFLTGHQQITLASTIEIVSSISKNYSDILDECGIRFYLGVKLFQLNLTKRISGQNLSIRMRDINFALHSDSKDLLLNIISEQCNLRIDLEDAKRYGLMYWLDNYKLREEMEKFAKNQFFKNTEANNGAKDPGCCSILYLALRKKQILLGLWKTASGNPDQAKMIKFLNNDFNEKRWKSAALKNAFVLLSKHRYRDSATFFLLADSLKDAVSVIIRHLNDLPLAIAVARCYEKCDDGPVLKKLLLTQILPDALTKGKKWTISWIFWLLGDKISSIQSLVKSYQDIAYMVNENEKYNDLFKTVPQDQIVNITTNDPILLMLYDVLRRKDSTYFKGATDLTTEEEFEFVLSVASMHERMGCDYLSLYLLKNWEFISTTKEEDNLSLTSQIEKKNLNTLRRRKSINNGTSINSAADPGAGMPSILDGFGDFGMSPANTVPAARAVNGNTKPVTTTTTVTTTDPLARRLSSSGSTVGSTTTSKEDEENKKKFGNRVAPPPAAFAEPDMSAFNFGF